MSAIRKSLSALYVAAMLLVSSTSFAAINISSYDGSEVNTPVGIPILAEQDGNLVFKYKPNGKPNNYVWLDQKNRTLSRDLVFAPTDSDVGKRVRLCDVKRSSMSCSNELRVSPSLNSRSNRTNALSFFSFWEYENFYDDDFLLDTQTSVTAITKFTYKDDAPEDGHVNAAKVLGILSADGVALATPIQLVGTTTKADKEVPFTFDSISFGNSILVKFCSFIMADSGQGSVIREDDKCVERLLRDGGTEGGDKNYFYPPSPQQFNALFKNVSYLNTETVVVNNESKTYVYAPRYDVNSQNLLVEYCNAIAGAKAEPLTEAMMNTFIASDEFDSSWPGLTGYWTNDNPTNLPSWMSFIPGGFGKVGILTPNQGNPFYELASNEYYNGYYICKRVE
ncbi:hypothetical protein QTN94_18195 [Vibrio sp. M250220]|uniref:hypothetical protein n=1 Tax=Vibrio sp. M250220 TaxID=3020894 RepID=UPI002F41A8F7